MVKHQIGDTVKLASKLCFGDDKFRQGTVTAVADDGFVTAEFPQPPYPPMTVTSEPEHLVPVRTAQSEVLLAHAAVGRLSVECDRLRAELEQANAENQRLSNAQGWDPTSPQWAVIRAAIAWRKVLDTRA